MLRGWGRVSAARSVWGAKGGVSAATLLLPLLPLAAAADPSEGPPNWHLFSGVDATRNAAFAHQGLVWAPGGNLHQSGWRIRGELSSGVYRYEKRVVHEAPGFRQTHRFDVIGQSLAASIMPGYEWLGEGRGYKFYAGPAVDDDRTRPHDPENQNHGTRVGFHGLAEAWVRVGETLIVDGSARFEVPGPGYAIRLAARWEAADWLTLEPEAALLGEPEYRQYRIGLFTDLYNTQAMRIQIGAGWAFDDEGDGPYGGARIKSWR